MDQIEKEAFATAFAKHDRKLLRMFGIDTRRLSAAEVAKGAKIIARLTKEPCSAGRPVNHAKAVADFEAFRARVTRSHRANLDHPSGRP
jgi:hypothetical protein